MDCNRCLHLVQGARHRIASLRVSPRPGGRFSLRGFMGAVCSCCCRGNVVVRLGRVVSHLFQLCLSQWILGTFFCSERAHRRHPVQPLITPPRRPLLFYEFCPLCDCQMPKRALSRTLIPASGFSHVEHVRKRQRQGETNHPTSVFDPNYITSAEDATRVDADQPLQKLLKAAPASLKLKTVEGTDAVVR
ncbi:hypothetical protein BJ322DRAFT_185364 [Thelephora terrestris]|uniref:Uncharacterized protein n=1 Tax=Thelephora terrestris TaxID=56493 RepID=A0A9P6HB61_9AGAM|nr:hypothetical protein BJ322DRAFT_185364 [Thelephora terrestris]